MESRVVFFFFVAHLDFPTSRNFPAARKGGPFSWAGSTLVSHRAPGTPLGDLFTVGRFFVKRLGRLKQKKGGVV